ncbi:hypothetical protein HNR46_003452 [Haloferula luteola]|uniref:Methyltransferase domain-containing protein n=1 Tax=Haloferula luteola TaxID=595692 RepID=A0A840VEZ1_9BACT|nr:hypothetical protein [Haloferula luteola]MBB5353198.1 hypothetical protein [Haloferula luteola]
MALLELSLNLSSAPLPDPVYDLIREADRRDAAFFEAGLGRKFSRYVPSDPTVVHASIASLKEQKLLRGFRFCEWGCGFGVAASIAAWHGFESYGIELVTELADLATQLAEDFDLKVEILNISYFPEGFDSFEGVGQRCLVAPDRPLDPDAWMPHPEYEGLDPSEVDLFYVFPWPGEEKMMMDLFEAVATEGAILLMYLGDGEMGAYLKDMD